MLRRFLFRIYRWHSRPLKHNGPAIWGGCVTRHKHQVGSWYFSHETVPVQGGYGVVFAVMIQMSGLDECRGTIVIIIAIEICFSILIKCT